MALDPSPRYRRDIDGLRAIAVTAVVLFHAGLYPLKSGFTGVDIFFVISGFLIGGIVYRDVGAGRFRFDAFYARRAARILPALMAVIASVTILGIVLASPQDYRQIAIGAIAALSGWSNILFWRQVNYFSPDAHLDPFLMTWSLGVEEQFYLLFPFLLLALRRLPRPVVLGAIGALCLGSFMLAVIGMGHWPTAVFYLLPTRAWELGAGTFLAIARAGATAPLPARPANILGFTGIGLVGLSVCLFNEHTPFPGLAALLPVGGTLALLLAERSIVNRLILSARPFVGVGLVSYSWYLWHWPLMAFTWLCMAQPARPVQLVVVAFVSLGLAVLSWRYIEQPFRHVRLPSRTVLLRYGSATALCGVALAAIYMSQGFPARFNPALAKTQASLTAGRGGSCLANYGDARPNTSFACVHDTGRLQIALLGDSHAAALAPALSRIAREGGYDFVQFTKSSCPPLLGATRLMPQHPGHAATCALYNERAISLVAHNPEVQLVVLTGYWSAPYETDASDDAYVDPTHPVDDGVVAGVARMQAALVRTETILTHAGKKVIVLGDVPHFRLDPAREAVTAFMPVRAWIEHRLDPGPARAGGIAPLPWVIPPAPAIENAVHAAATTIGGITYASLYDRFCTPQGCRFSRESASLYVDSQHLSGAGGEFALNGLIDVAPSTMADK
ncbi:acyltransferase [Komagataeibacter sp. AV436]|uniref:Acyltransferase n=1 Tax=Komagataeibacter melomenusus TaxID=2766578 RepID=A0ABX2AGQ1_9PROT|nr:acyltransferase family protein [Komagataeibacter melomenusus]MBV1831685.1 acyltransferase [Komagataeibacter melomenusus]NPC67518.1 acyltransferase [Komagataeibacter melomenusus]